MPGRVALVTGASSGIGRATVVELRRRGVKVMAVARRWAERARSCPADRLVTPAEVAATIAFLASEEASGVNGEALTVALGGLW